MLRLPFLLLLSLPLFSCSDDTACASATAGTPSATEPEPTGGQVPSEGCCDVPASEMCPTHPFGRAIGCDNIRRPQTTKNRIEITDLNSWLCASEYVACRDKLREVPCDVCPEECEGILGACS